WEKNVEEAVALPIRSAYGKGPLGFLLAGVSPRKRLDEAYQSFYLQAAQELGEAIREARMVEREVELLAQGEAERKKIRDLFMQAPAAIMMLRGPQHEIVLVNDRYSRLVGRKAQSDLAGKRIAEALPEIVAQGFLELLDG